MCFCNTAEASLIMSGWPPTALQLEIATLGDRCALSLMYKHIKNIYIHIWITHKRLKYFFKKYDQCECSSITSILIRKTGTERVLSGGLAQWILTRRSSDSWHTVLAPDGPVPIGLYRASRWLQVCDWTKLVIGRSRDSQPALEFYASRFKKLAGSSPTLALLRLGCYARLAR